MAKASKAARNGGTSATDGDRKQPPPIDIAVDQQVDQLRQQLALRTRKLALANELLLLLTADRKLSEESVRASEERFRQLAENVDEVFWLATADTTQILYIN